MMSEGERTPGPEDAKKPDGEVSDVDLLFQEDAKRPRSQSVHLPASGSSETFDLEEPIAGGTPPPRPVPVQPTAPVAPQPVRPPVSPQAPSHSARPVERAYESERDREFREASSSAFEAGESVDQVWSRWREWGLSFLALGVWSMVLLYVIFVLLESEYFNLALLVWIVGGFFWLYLLYPILITLEIPVRLTPESAVKDYYGSLSHHMPHHRRMWLLLARQGRLTPYFGSYEGFRNYWKKRVGELKKLGKADVWTPLLFQVESFGSEKSKDKSLFHVQFVVKVFVRGRRDEGPIAIIPVKSDLVRGPDKMLYLTNGVLPEVPEN